MINEIIHISYIHNIHNHGRLVKDIPNETKALVGWHPPIIMNSAHAEQSRIFLCYIRKDGRIDGSTAAAYVYQSRHR